MSHIRYNAIHINYIYCMYVYLHVCISARPCVNICVRPCLLCPIWFESAIFKLIAYPRSKVKEVKEFLSGCHLRLIKTRQTDEIPRHSPFLFKFLIFHSSEASPVAWWLMSKKSVRKNWQINLGQFNILRIIVSLINIFDCLQKFYSKCEDYLHLCITVSFFSLSMIWRNEGR